ncbi:MAG: transcriptional regulator [Planctomycetaceae bacterium]|nr:transcriptional regulator [Planctomycetaceae bacterium]
MRTAPEDSPAVPLLDINRENRLVRDEVQQALARVCDAGCFLYGDEVRRLEARIAERCQVAHAVSCASGSDALLLALMAHRIGAGDEVILPSFTFFATAGAVWRLGARPVFVDIDPVTYNLSPERVEAAITPRTRAVIPVHLFGRCAEMAAIGELAGRRDLMVIEDAAQAIAAVHGDRAAGAWGDIGCFSFYPTKNLGGFGDGGMLTTSDQATAERLRLLAAHGMHPRYYHSRVGINSRLDTLQAAVLNIKEGQLDRMTARRRANADRYREWFSATVDEAQVILPADDPHGFHVWNQFTMRIPDGRRDALRSFLQDRQIGTEVYYPVPLHRQDCFAELGYGSESLPHTECAAAEVLSLPIFPELTVAEQRAVVGGVADFFSAANRAVA